jgi:peptidoglycan-N-acetylglucosamine deacetylase
MLYVRGLFFLALALGAIVGKDIGIAQEIALTFDDFPMGTTPLLEKRERVKIFADKLARLDIQVAFFCIGEQLDSDIGLECLEVVAQDHLLANHTSHHYHLSELTLEEFAEEIRTTEMLLCEYSNFRKWFRFPYLDYGDRTQLGGGERKRCAAFLFLRQNGYQHGYITINTYDWYVNAALKKAIQEKREVYWENLKRAYLSLLEEWIEAYDQRWQEIYKKKFVHVLLLHQSDLNEIVDFVRQKQWKIVSPQKAFDAPVSYLAKFANTKSRLFRGVAPFSAEHIESVLEAHHAFEVR